MIPLYSKSSVGVDDTCSRAYYLAYEEEGHGIKGSSTGLELHLGTCLHDALAVIAIRQKAGEEVNINQIATTAFNQAFEPIAGDGREADKVYFAKEQACLIEGLIRGFYKQIWPRLMANYTIAQIELPLLYRHDGKAMMTKGDLVLEAPNGELVYFEYKSTSSKKEEWITSWNTAPQIHTSIAALRQNGHDVEQAIVQGLYKGYNMMGKQTSILCYGYKKAANPPFSKEIISYDYKPGLRKFPVWEMEGGVESWIDRMPSEILADQFPQTPLIYWNQELAETFFRQQNYRQEDIKVARGMLSMEEETTKQYVLDRYFPQKFDKCYASFGKPCPFVNYCHGPAKDAPLSHGFEKRSLDHLSAFTSLLTEEEKNA